MDKRLHSSLPHKSQTTLESLRTAKAELTAIGAKVYNALFLNCIKPEIEKILRKNQNSFQRNHSTTSQILIICWIIEWVQSKNLEVTQQFVDFSKAFDSIYRGKIEQILLTYDLPKETVTAIMMLYKNMKAMVCSPDEDTDFFNRDILAPYLFIFGLGYILQMSKDLIKENGFILKKKL